MISWMRELCDLDHPPHQAQRVRSYMVTRLFAQDPRSTSSHQLPVGETAEAILKDVDEKIMSFQASARAKKQMTKFLPPLNTCSRKYCRFEGSMAPQFLLLLRYSAELPRKMLYNIFFRADVTFTSS